MSWPDTLSHEDMDLRVREWVLTGAEVYYSKGRDIIHIAPADNPYPYPKGFAWYAKIDGEWIRDEKGLGADDWVVINGLPAEDI